MRQLDAPPKTSAYDVAVYFLHLAASEEEADLLSHLRLQKLLYYAQAWSLANRDRPLFHEQIEAWTHGPVVRDVYRRFADCGDALLTPPTGQFHLSNDDKAFVLSVWDAYKDLSATALRNMTHNEEPWVSAFRGPNKGQKPGVISQEAMRDYFRSR